MGGHVTAPPKVIGWRKLVDERRHLRLVKPPRGHRRPRTRAECVDGVRPCPWVSCRHHMYLDVRPDGGIRLNFPDLAFDEIPKTCALDLADLGGLTLEEVGTSMNITRERVRQVEAAAMGRLSRIPEVKEAFRALIDDQDD